MRQWNQIRTWHGLAVALWVMAAALGAHLAWSGWRALRPAAPGSPLVAARSPAFQWPALAPHTWRVFRSGAPVAPAPVAGTLAARYRLAGVFLILTEPHAAADDQRCAILDDLQTKEQILAQEGERAGESRVVRVTPDYVILADGEHEEIIMLAAGATGASEKQAAPAAAESAAVWEATRFGHRVGDSRWEVNRSAVLAYYQEMMDNPERLAGLFMAMEPDRDAAGRVAGYRLNTALGEKDFYNQVGLRDGDVVRRVNSMRMTSQRRAEYFIGEFVQNRLGAVVLDIEREGQPQKLIYLVKE